MHTIHRLCRHCIEENLPQVNVVRGKDGFGFTICSDCPVRVQAVDPGGPAHQSGLRHGDSLLQLNGVPVETWKCVDLAHAIRNSPSHIVLVVWRLFPEFRSEGETQIQPQAKATGRKLLPHPKHGRRWKENKQEVTSPKEVTSLLSPHTATHMTSSHGDNYIILSPVEHEQMLQPLYQDRNGTIGRLYQTHPRRPALSRQSFSSTLPPPSATLGNYGNYQNCTIVQSHAPYGSYVTVAPKTLIFPVFVQPLDLCSDRTLLLAEEMILHQDDMLPAKVTVLVYSDLLLFTREDEAGRCNVLQSPVFMNTLQLREAPSQPLWIFLVVSRCVSALEAFSFEQKVRVHVCLHDNMQQQLAATETHGHTHQVCDLPSDFGLMTLSQSELLYSAAPRSLSPQALLHTHSEMSPVWKEKERGEREEREERGEREQRGERGEREEREQGEGESCSETSENRRVCLSPQLSLEEELTFTPQVLRRSLSEGSLLMEPRSPRFLSDSTIHRLTRPPTFDPDDVLGHASTPLSPSHVLGPSPRPSIEALRRQLTTEGRTLQHMMQLLNGNKDSEFKVQLKKKKNSLAADVRSRLPFLRRRRNSSSFHGNSLEKALRNNRPCMKEVLKWAESLETLLTNQYGLAVFRHFLRSEFSEENLDFWLAVERFKKTRPQSKMAAKAAKIYDEFISTNAVRQVNVDSSVRESTYQRLRFAVGPALFQPAQDQVYGLMETDSYKRFIRSRLYAQMTNQG